MQKKVGIACGFLFLVFCGFQIFYSTGVVGVTKKSNHVFVNPGCICHDRNTNVRVWISGAESLAAGRWSQYRISVAKDSNLAAGFNVAANLGVLGIVDTAGTQLLRPNETDTLELTHVEAKLAHGRDTVSWFFWYKAPSTFGITDTIYANGNSVNLSLDPDGDAWNFAPNFLVRVASPVSVKESSIAQSYLLLQNYPNPFNPSTTIRYEIPVEGRVELKVFDVAGREVCILVNELQGVGLHQVSFTISGTRDLASGVYLYRIAVQPSGTSGKQYVEVKKMLLLK